MISIHALLAESDAINPVTGLFWQNFYPRSPCGERLCNSRGSSLSRYFYPRSPCGERRRPQLGKMCLLGISIHALLAESDRLPGKQNTLITDFYPRSPCGERRARIHNADVKHKISIHALLAESDPYNFDSFCQYIISIHALLAESDTESGKRSLTALIFLSTLSLRRATAHQNRINKSLPYFYPRSPCGERPAGGNNSSHYIQFLSTLSLRRATIIVFFWRTII